MVVLSYDQYSVANADMQRWSFWSQPTGLPQEKLWTACERSQGKNMLFDDNAQPLEYPPSWNQAALSILIPSKNKHRMQFSSADYLQIE